MEEVFDCKPKDDQEQIAMESIMENYPDGSIHKVYSMPNANYSDPNNVPSGIVTIHPVDAVVHPDSVPNEMFEYLVVCKINDPENELTDDTFRGKEALLAKEIPQYSSQPPRLIGMRPKQGPDLKTWSPELGKNGYAGIYKQISENGRDSDYFVVVYAGAPVACKEFKKLVVNGEKRKFSEMLMDPSFNYTKDIARRNAERLAYCVSRLLGVQIPQVVDGSAHVSQSYIAKPYRAAPLPGWCQDISAIEPVSYNGKECVGVYHNVRSVKKTTESCFVAAGPYEGITIFNMKGTTKGYGMPADTGRSSTVQRSVSDSTMKKRARGFTWEQRMDDHHPRLVPGKHGRVDDGFLEKMKELGWRQEGVQNRRTLTPVIVKLGNPKIERK